MFSVGVLLLSLVIAQVLHAGTDPQKEAEETRRTLRQQGFKTDLSDFDFSTDSDTAMRAAALTNVIRLRPIMLLQAVPTESGVVAWKESSFHEEEGFQSLPPVEESLREDQAHFDAACAAALSGAIRFPLQAKHGASMLLVHLSGLQSLAQTLTAREIIALREKRYDEAWTNLLAVTRLTTVWNPEASEGSHLVRFKLARTAWKAAWQALQAHHLSDEQLSLLQREWEAADFFKGLPETVAFTRSPWWTDASASGTRRRHVFTSRILSKTPSLTFFGRRRG